MYTFLVALMPAVLICYISLVKDKSVVSPAFVGFVSSALFCAIKAFFSFSRYLPSAHFFVNYAYALLVYTLVPIVVVYAIFWIISRDDMDFKIKSYFPLLCAFFSVYIPYMTLAGSRSAYAAFELFERPALYLCMLAFSSRCLLRLYRASTRYEKHELRLNAALFVISLFIPAFVETLWFMRFPLWTWLLLFILYALFTAGIVCANSVHELTRINNFMSRGDSANY